MSEKQEMSEQVAALAECEKHPIFAEAIKNLLEEYQERFAGLEMAAAQPYGRASQDWNLGAQTATLSIIEDLEKLRTLSVTTEANNGTAR